MLEYTELKRNRRTLLAFTGLTFKEFKALLPPFVEAYRRMYEGEQTVTGHKRQRLAGGGAAPSRHLSRSNSLSWSI